MTGSGFSKSDWYALEERAYGKLNTGEEYVQDEFHRYGMEAIGDGVVNSGACYVYADGSNLYVRTGVAYVDGVRCAITGETISDTVVNQESPAYDGTDIMCVNYHKTGSELKTFSAGTYHYELTGQPVMDLSSVTGIWHGNDITFERWRDYNLQETGISWVPTNTLNGAKNPDDSTDVGIDYHYAGAMLVNGTTVPPFCMKLADIDRDVADAGAIAAGDVTGQRYTSVPAESTDGLGGDPVPFGAPSGTGFTLPGGSTVDGPLNVNGLITAEEGVVAKGTYYLTVHGSAFHPFTGAQSINDTLTIIGSIYGLNFSDVSAGDINVGGRGHIPLPYFSGSTVTITDITVYLRSTANIGTVTVNVYRDADITNSTDPASVGSDTGTLNNNYIGISITPSTGTHGENVAFQVDVSWDISNGEVVNLVGMKITYTIA